MQWSVARTALILVITAAMAACGGGSSSSNNTVAQVTVSPSTISLVSGQVTSQGLTAIATNSSGGNVITTFTFNSSNPRLVTVSPSALVCAGVWDSNFVTCNGNDPSGNPLTGTATITATAGGVSSAPVTVSVHPSVTSIQIGSLQAGGTCLSNGQTHQFTATAFHNATDITSAIGSFNWRSTDATVVTVDPNGLATARGPGQAGIIASAGAATTGGSVSSQAVTFKSCMPARIILHVTQETTQSVTMNTTDTKIIQADMIDENGVPVLGAPVTMFSNNAAVATVAGPTSGATLTAVSPGGAGIIAACSPPRCGNGIVKPLYSNLFSVTVSGASPATTVYVGTTAFPPAGTASALVPVDTSKTPPAAGTAINLPGAANSIVFQPNGIKAYVGTTSGLVALDPLANTATLVDADAVGKVLAVSPDGTKAIVSNVIYQSAAPSQRIFVFDQSANTLQTFILPGAVAAKFDYDGFRAYIAANNGSVYVYSPFQTLRTLALAGSPLDLVPLSSDQLVYLANGSGLSAFNVCDNSPATTVPATSAVQLVDAVRNANILVAANSTGLDIETATVPDDSASFCPVPVTYSDQVIDFGLGAITARQLLVGSNGAHIIVLPQGLPEIAAAIPGGGPGIIPLAAGATEALSGGMTPDGNTVWVGVAGSNELHRINLLTATDDFQIQLNLNGANAVPDLVAVRPK